MATDDDLLKDAQEAFALCRDREADDRQAYVEDTRFARLGEQWDERDRIARAGGQQTRQTGLNADGSPIMTTVTIPPRPMLTINKMPAMIRQVVNDARRNRPSITVHAVDSDADPDTAEIMSGLIRQIEYASKAAIAYDTAIDNAVTGGFGYFRINTVYSDDDSFAQDIRIERIVNPLSVYGDPYSTSATSEDWDVAFVVEEMKRDRFKALFKDASPQSDWDAGGAYDRLPEGWGDRDTVMIAEWWQREETKTKIVMLSSGQVVKLADYEANRGQSKDDDGLPAPGFDALGVTVVGSPRDIRSHKVTQRRLTGTEVLDTTPWAGQFIPIVPVYGDEVWVEGKRYLRGMVRDARDPQRQFNFWRTTATEVAASAPRTPFIGAVGSFDTDPNWAASNSASLPFLEYDPVPGQPKPERQPFVGVPAGMLQEALNASDDIKAVTGLYDASLGARSNETSGVAIRARQGQGDNANFHFTDNQARSIEHAGVILIDLIPHIYNSERTARVIGKEGPQTARPVQLGAPGEGQPAQPQTDPATGQPVVGPDGVPVMASERIYDLSLGKYDLTVEAGPANETQREAAVEGYTEMIRAYPPGAPVLGPLILRNTDLPGAKEAADKLEALSNPQGGAPDPQHQAQLDQAGQAVKQASDAARAAQEQAQTLAQQLQQTQAQLAEVTNGLKERELDIKAVEAQAKLLAAQNSRPPAVPGGLPQGAFAQ